MRTRIVLIITTIIIISSACQINENNSDSAKDNGVVDNVENQNKNNNTTDNSKKEVIELNFASVEKEVLIESQPDEMWILGKSFYFGNLPNQIESKLHLYVENSSDTDIKPGDGIVYGFLEHKGKLYDLGEVSCYGIDRVSVDLTDRTLDGIKEIEIIGGMGATYIQMKVISYSETSKEWENLLTMGSPQIVDLDEDGQEELIAVSAGSVPGFVDIYRWNGDSFEKSSITAETGNAYAGLDTKDNKWIIETGIFEEGKTLQPTLYKYENGKLIEIIQ